MGRNKNDGKSQVHQVIQYIQRQEELYKKKTFLEEYREFLNAFEIKFDERSIFKPIEY
ncbi:MAG: hypothetical protein GW876_05660 [Bacteroidetes bacterium]|nr:hypothetical protein [Bacteroidota bacterium]